MEAEAPTEAQPPPPHASGCFPHSSPQRGAEPVPVLISAAVPMDHVQIAQRAWTRSQLGQDMVPALPLTSQHILQSTAHCLQEA